MPSTLGMNSSEILKPRLNLHKGLLSKLGQERSNFIGSGFAQQGVLDFPLGELKTENSAVVLVGDLEEGEGVVKLDDVRHLTLVQAFEGFCNVFVQVLFEIATDEAHVSASFRGHHFGEFLRDLFKVVTFLYGCQGIFGFLSLDRNLIRKPPVNQ